MATERRWSLCADSVAGQENMHGLDCSTDLEMEMIEDDEVMVRHKDS